MWWLCFERDGRLLGVAIVEAYSLPAARMRAALQGVDRVGNFSEGHQLDARCCARLTPDDVGRMLSPQEVNALLERFEHNGTAGKRPSAPSMRRRLQRTREAS
jgi:hypothetical protein